MTIIDKSNPDIVIFDNLDPESAAMVLALYSRDPRSVREHLEQVAKVGPGKFMGQYYVGYGHKSIGDCGSTTVCAEWVSMLTAKAIQHNRLYNGQEASTRYLDMTAQPVLNPLGTEAGRQIQERWMSLYSNVLSELVSYLTYTYPRLESDNPKVYTKAIMAKAFDIARAFLPAGCTTFVGWHSNLRQAWDHLKEMSFHPLAEVREVGGYMLSELQKKYPSSFGFKSYVEQDAYLAECSTLTYEDREKPTWFIFEPRINRKALNQNSKLKTLLQKRPAKTELPEIFERFGQIRFEFPLDFGSFRDLQRQRSCIQAMPLLTIKHGFNSWYLNSLPENLRKQVEEVRKIQEVEILKIQDLHVRQYYIAMGYDVICDLTAGLPSVIYIAELRSGQTVHPTLRSVAQDMAKAMKSLLPDMALHCDMGPDEWSVARGKHDIVRKDK